MGENVVNPELNNEIEESSENVFSSLKLTNVTVIDVYTDISFCGKRISKRKIYAEIKPDIVTKYNKNIEHIFYLNFILEIGNF